MVKQGIPKSESKFILVPTPKSKEVLKKNTDIQYAHQDIAFI